MIRKISQALVLVLLASVVLTGCGNTTWKSESGNPTLENRIKWKKFLKVSNAKEVSSIGTTSTHISNVSHQVALAKMNQALQSYSDNLGYKLSSVFQIADHDESEGEKGPAVIVQVIDGHLYYIGFLDWLANSNSMAAYEQTKRTIPAIVVVDGEDNTLPGWVRTRDDDGNQYHIMLHYSVQALSGYDDNNIYRHLRNRGYSTAASCNSLDHPLIEIDEKWKPYFIMTYNVTDNCTAGITGYGSLEWPEYLLVVDAQTTNESGLKKYSLDNPMTGNNERDPAIPKWIDQIYSPRVVRDWIAAWGYNPANYGKTSTVDDFQLDAGHLDEVMNEANTNIVFVGYITSTQKDDSLIGFMLIDPQTGTATLHETQGKYAMATKSSAINAIIQATHRWDYFVEDLTLHTIYGVPTWQGELARPAYDDAGNRYGSLYCGTVLIQANYDHMPSHVQWGVTKHEAFTKYERWLILSRTERVGSNVEEIKELTGSVEKVQQLVLDGNTDYLVNISGQTGLYSVPVDYIGNPLNEAAINLHVGDQVYIRYADPINTKTYLVLEIRNLTKVGPAEEQSPHLTSRQLKRK